MDLARTESLVGKYKENVAKDDKLKKA